MSTLVTYKTIGGGAVQEVSPDPSAAAGLALNTNFRAIADSIQTLESDESGLSSASGTLATGDSLTVTHPADTAGTRECFAMATATVAGTNQVPAMTSDTTPSGVASASSFYASGYDAYRAFDHLVDHNGWATSSGDTGPSTYIRYDFGSAVLIADYAVTAVTDSGSMGQQPASWMWQGSTDGSTWTTLDTRSGLTWSPSQRRLFSVGNTTAYRYYQLIDLVPVSSSLVQLAEFELISPDTTVSGPVLVGNAALDSAATDRFIAEWGDGSGGSLTTKTTFTNNFSTTVSAVVSVRV